MTNTLDFVHRGASGLLTGYSVLALDSGKIRAIIADQRRRGTLYGLGCKPSDLSASPAVFHDFLGRYGGGTVNRVDCSGDHRYMIWHATGGAIVPDGSSTQNDWYAARGFKHHETAANDPYYLTGLSRQIVYACFCRQGTRGETIGHVWLVMWDDARGMFVTYESHGGLGPDSRPHTALAAIVTDVYAIGYV